MTTLNLADVVSNYNRELKKLKEEMCERFKEELRTAFKTVFAEYPNVTRLVWTQYTPYFNDGDPCVFSVNDLNVFDETCAESDDDDDDYYDGVYVGWGEGAERYPLLKNIGDSLSRADDLLLEMFGDHCKITVTPEGIDVEEYDHD
jgi:hypothetical protein